MLKKSFKFFLGIILIPSVISTFYHLPSIFASLNSYFDPLVLLFLGVILYVVFEAVFSRPMRTYVFGHELTHALVSMLMGGKIHSFKVSEKGGSVTVSKTNAIVALAPYCFPIYTFFILITYFLLKFWIAFEKYQTVFFVLIGLSLAFHLSLTFHAIRQGQPDIKKTGTFFSLILIALVNAWILILLSKLLFWNLFSVKQFFMMSLKTQILIWKWVLAECVKGSLWILKQWIQSGQQNPWILELKSYLENSLLTFST